MTSLQRKALLPLCLFGSLLPGRAALAQCETDDWTLYAATGEIVEVETQNEEAWIASDGGMIRIDLSTIESDEPAQVKIADTEGLVSTDLTCLTIDAFGNVWVGTREDGVSVFDAQGNHLRNLFAFDDLVWSDKIIAMDALRQSGTCFFADDGDSVSLPCDRVVISSADSYAASTGLPEGGGFVVVRIGREGGRWLLEREGFANTLDRSQELLLEPGRAWIGTGGQGLWELDDATGVLERVLSQSEGGLLSDNVKELVRAPAAGPPGPDVLWIGTGAGLQTWDGAEIDTVEAFAGHNILDLFHRDDKMWVISETEDPLNRDLYEIFLPLDSLTTIDRSDCSGDTDYVPREVAVSQAGRIVLGTKSRSFSVRQGLDWLCPPPLGPHWPVVADLDLGLDGTLYFGTGDTRRSATPNGVGLFDGTDWSSITAAGTNLLDNNITEIEVWPDSTIWFGSRVSQDLGGLHRYDPRTGEIVIYTDDVVDSTRITLGRNIWEMELDAQDNLWVCYGQEFGGLSVVEYPSRRITNYPFEVIFDNATTALRDIAFDSAGRVWVTTQSSGTTIGRVYVVDPNGTVHDRSDDDYTDFNLANDIFPIGEVPAVTVDAFDQVWLAGEQGLVVGQITADVNGQARASWEEIEPSPSQLGGRNPKPYRVAALDWDNNVWLGTESAGLVRVSSDQVAWTWFDQLVPCPLPDQSITGLHIEDISKTIYVGTATGGIAKIALRTSRAVGGADLEAYPNPWVFADHGPVVTFGGIPPDETTTLRIFTVAGELVLESEDLRGVKTWDGTNVGGVLVESGVYIVVAVSSDGSRNTYEGKVAIIR